MDSDTDPETKVLAQNMDAGAGRKPCCSPARETSPIINGTPVVSTAPRVECSTELMRSVYDNLVDVPGGFFQMGTRKPNYPNDFEGPERRVWVSAFTISQFAVTNAQFEMFVNETGYETIAEREGWSYVLHLLLENPQDHPNYAAQTPWWRQVMGAAWDMPEGPGSSIKERENHPVTHVCWMDAVAFCAHLGLSLPTEAQWEKAARSGQKGKLFPWGNTLVSDGQHKANTWQGQFPRQNTCEDGYLSTAPVDAFEPNKFGMYNVIGNVWEWCGDWFGNPYTSSKSRVRDPAGPAIGETRVIKGGSFMCHVSYCQRYHLHSRTGNAPDSTASHIGFRYAK